MKWIQIFSLAKLSGWIQSVRVSFICINLVRTADQIVCDNIHKWMSIALASIYTGEPELELELKLEPERERYSDTIEIVRKVTLLCVYVIYYLNQIWILQFVCWLVWLKSVLISNQAG